ncbi:MAG TPA: hypothetical protein VI727_10410 [Candidatus Brocadiaceae bacterium]|nr:hypothetical protein [Candidatus Brocadiaceae bacterium]
MGYSIFLGWMITGPNTRNEVEKSWGIRTKAMSLIRSHFGSANLIVTSTPLYYSKE